MEPVRLPITTCQLLVDPPKRGIWNMSADETLLDTAVRSNVAALRFYRWREPTLSLGYFQRFSERMAHPPSQGAPVVRRLSGGGAIVHDHEITYSLALPASHPLARNHQHLYTLVHQALINTLHDHGVTARMHGEKKSIAGARDNRSGVTRPMRDPFLCFQRHCPGDVMISDHDGTPAKILGSAQRRRHGALLQHGSLLLAASQTAPDLPGLRELTRREPIHSKLSSYLELMEPWYSLIAENLGLHLLPSQWGSQQLHSIQQYQQTKYYQARWTEAR